jgi:hypothetical protein
VNGAAFHLITRTRSAQHAKKGLAEMIYSIYIEYDMNIERKQTNQGISGAPSSKPFDRATREYIAGNAKVSEISKRAGISAGALSSRVKRLGLPLRGRGRNPLEKPTAVHKKIIAAAAKQTYEHVGLRFGISKQRVSKIVQRWNGLDCTRASRTKDKRKLYVISFRVDQKIMKRLQKELQNPHFRHFRSPNNLARELLAICLEGNRIL